jgi:hypothetical protein
MVGAPASREQWLVLPIDCPLQRNLEAGGEGLLLADRCQWPCSPEWRLRFSTATPVQLWEQDNKAGPRIAIQAEAVCRVRVKL